jgi:hypothetical protein
MTPLDDHLAETAVESRRGSLWQNQSPEKTKTKPR